MINPNLSVEYFVSEPQLIPIFSTGAGAPEEAAAGGGRQVCVGGESVHHGGQLQLLGRGGLAGRSQRPGERRSSLSLGESAARRLSFPAAAAAAAAVSTWLFDPSRKPAGGSEVFGASCRSSYWPGGPLGAGQRGEQRDKEPDVVFALWSAGVGVNHLI